MTQFKSAEKPLGHFREKPLGYFSSCAGVKALVANYGDRLDALSQEDKYQLALCITLYLLSQIEGAANTSTANLLEISQEFFTGASGRTFSALQRLNRESPEELSQLLPAITAYARDDDR